MVTWHDTIELLTLTLFHVTTTVTEFKYEIGKCEASPQNETFCGTARFEKTLIFESGAENIVIFFRK